MLKVLGIAGSPRKRGNTDLLLDAFLESAAESGADTEKIWLRKLEYKPCLELNVCQKTGECILNDDMTPIYTKLIEADVIVIASPIFFWTVSADMKAFIDRCQSFWSRKHILDLPVPLSAAGNQRKGVFISAAGHVSDTIFNGATGVVKTLFETLDMKIDVALTFAGYDDKGDILRTDHPINSARAAATELISSFPDRQSEAPAKE